MKHYMSFAKGMGAGIVAGMAAAATVSYVCKHNHKLCKKTTKAARALSDIMEDIQSLLN